LFNWFINKDRVMFFMTLIEYKKKREVHQFDLMASRLHIVSTVVHTIHQMYFGGLSIRIGSGETVRITTFADLMIRRSLFH
jgi:hypothetical protein